MRNLRCVEANMSNTIELPTHLDNTLALKFIPVVELQENFGNFEQWEHSVRFYLRYHRLLKFIEGNEEGTVPYMYPPSDEMIEENRHRRLFVYSLIWKSAVAIFRLSPLSKDLENELYQNRDHDPKQLWKILHTHKDSVRNLQQLDY